jgi:predicted cobalt transporter CbtA
MTRELLIRGMLAGVFAAILAVLFARILAEPQVDLAIAFEASHHASMHHAAAAAPEPELVSRATQKGLGLLTAVGLYGAAVGGIFALVFAVVYGRIGSIGPRSLALLLALGAFLAIALVPALKYPPTPPAVGQHETVAFRTIAYFAMIAFSVVALILSIKLGTRIVARAGMLNGILLGAGGYVMLVSLLQFVLPPINEVPAGFPAVVLWNFRIAAIAMQAVLWAMIGLSFGAMADRVLRRA